MRSRSLEHREMLVDMAAIWELLANDLIKTAKGLERIAKLAWLNSGTRARTRARVSKVTWEMGRQLSARERLADAIMSR